MTDAENEAEEFIEKLENLIGIERPVPGSKGMDRTDGTGGTDGMVATDGKGGQSGRRGWVAPNL